MIITLEYKDRFTRSYLMDPNTDSLCNIDSVIYLRHKFGEKERMIYLGYTGSALEAFSIIKSTRSLIEARDNTELELTYDEDNPQEDFVRFVKLMKRGAKG